MMTRTRIGGGLIIGKIMLWFVVSIAVGVALASYRYPFFLNLSQGNWQLDNASAVEANLLVIASLLVGVAGKFRVRLA